MAEGAVEEIVHLVDVHQRFGETPAPMGSPRRRRERFGIIGRSGAGKSTLIRCLNGLERCDSGEIHIEGRNIAGLSERELQPLRRRIGMIFQHFNLLSAKTVEENVALPLKIAGVAKAERLRRAGELLDLVGLSDKARAFPSSLSGGQKQRRHRPRACRKAHAALSDEATSRSIPNDPVDPCPAEGHQSQAQTDNFHYPRDGSGAGIADRVAVIDAGRIVKQGPVDQCSRAAKYRHLKPALVFVPVATIWHAGYRDRRHGSNLQRRSCRPGGTRSLFDLSVALPHSFRLVLGGIDHIQNRPVARFFM